MQKRFDVREWPQSVRQRIAQLLVKGSLILKIFFPLLPQWGEWLFKNTVFYFLWLVRAAILCLFCLTLLATLGVQWPLARYIALAVALFLSVLDLRDRGEPKDRWDWLKTRWWYWYERWPLVPVLVFIKALPLLGLWLLVAYGIYKLWLEGLSSQPTALIGTLVATLVGFGIQQWKMLSSAEEERKKDLQVAKVEIEQWRMLLQSNPSEGARRYLELSAKGGAIWKSGQIQNALEEAWRDTTPTELREAMQLLRATDETELFLFYSLAHDMRDKSRPALALEWVRNNLDDDWRRKALKGIKLLHAHPDYRETLKESQIQDIEKQRWIQILGPWPQLSFWCRFPLSPDDILERGLSYLGLTSPFGDMDSGMNKALLKENFNWRWWRKFQRLDTALYEGEPGLDRTATIVGWAHHAFRRNPRVFPVYWRGTPVQLQFEALACSLAHTLLHYLTVTPEDFLKSSIGRKASMAHLLGRYFTPRLTYHFRRAGVPEVGEGAQMVQEIETLAQSAPTDAPLSENELLILLRQARPRPFDATLMLLDVQSTPQDPRLWGRRLSIWCEKLGHAGVFIKVFMPPMQASAMTPLTESLDIPHYDLTFSSAKLKAILEQRLKHSGESALREWCDPVIRSSLPDLDAWIVHAAEGKPGQMFRLGNELIRRIGQKQALLTLDDLIDILGDPPEEAAA